MFMQAATKASCAPPNQMFVGIIQDKKMKIQNSFEKKLCVMKVNHTI